MFCPFQFGLVDNGVQKKFATNCFTVLNVVQFYYYTPMEIVKEIGEMLLGRKSEEEMLHYVGKEMVYPFFPNQMVLQFVFALLRYFQSRQPKRDLSRAKHMPGLDTSRLRSLLEYLMSRLPVFSRIAASQQRLAHSYRSGSILTTVYFTPEVVVRLAALFDESPFRAKCLARMLLNNPERVGLDDIISCVVQLRKCNWEGSAGRNVVRDMLAMIEDKLIVVQDN
jgi:hypothetical protein